MNRLGDPDEARAHLIAAATADMPVTYAGILELLGFSFSRPLVRHLCALLAEVDRRAEAAGEPPLAAYVVRQSDGLPGQGWWIGTAKAHDYKGLWEGPEARAFVVARQQEAHRYWSKKGQGAR